MIINSDTDVASYKQFTARQSLQRVEGIKRDYWM